MKKKPQTIDEYLSVLDKEKRTALNRLRKVIKSAARGAEECISYRMPAFRYKGRMLVWFGAGKGHCAFYPGGIVECFKDELKPFKTSKGTIRFQPECPIPTGLVRKIVKARVAQNEAVAAKGRR